MPLSLDEIRRLSVAERLRLIEDIWSTIPESEAGLPLSDAQRRELERRLHEFERSPKTVRSWPEVKETLRRSDPS